MRAQFVGSHRHGERSDVSTEAPWAKAEAI